MVRQATGLCTYDDDPEIHTVELVTKLQPLPVGIFDQYGNQIADSVGRSLVITDIDHYIIHRGCSFLASDTITVAPLGSAPANRADFVIHNSTEIEVHLKDFAFTSTAGDAEIILYHQITADADGTLINIHNKNFVSTKTSTATMRLDPSNVVIGAAEHQVQHFLITGGKHTGGLADSGAEEYVIKQDEKILLRYINNSNGEDKFSYKVSFLDVGKL